MQNGVMVGRRSMDNDPVGDTRRVVVIGASVAGLLAAAACADSGCSVTVLERDDSPQSPTPRRGVPQGSQPHVYLYRGLLALEEMLPGICAALREAGAVSLDTGDLAWLGETGWAPPGRREFEILSLTRPLFEHVLRRRVMSLPNVRIRDASRVEALHRDSAGAPWSVALAEGLAMKADLVIDASGRASRLPVWLERLGFGPARVCEVDPRIGYATREYAVPPGVVAPAGVVVLRTPQTLAGGLGLPVEEGHWLVTATGSGDRRPPRDPAKFEAFLAALRDDALAEVVGAAEPLGDVSIHRQTGNRRHQYERLRRWPTGLLVVGDALCAFNPVYGQGVTVAACEALMLRDALRVGLRPGGERRLLRRFARVVALPWAIATSEDRRYPSCEGSPRVHEALLGRWTQELGRLAGHGDQRAQAAMSRVYHLMGSPLLLFQPQLVARSVRCRMRGYGQATERPTILTASARRPAGTRRG
ncbi:MAG: FAD-dependent monooxygenase [Ornithinimicrobium sp.]